jgi:glycosyltransferase 2 family protein
MRKLIVAIVILLCVIFIIARYSEVEAIFKTIREGDWRFILIAVLIEIIWLINVAASYKFIFQATGVEEKMEKLVLMSSAAYFLNVVAPTAGMSGMAVFISEAKRRGYSAARVTVAGVLFVLFDYLGFFCILGLGLLVLFRRNSLTSIEIIATLILIVIASVITFLLILGTHSVEGLGSVLAKGARSINISLWPFIHREYISETRAKEFALDASDGLKALRKKPHGVIVPFGLAISSKALLIIILLLMFLAFNIPPSPGTIIAAFSLGYLFLIVSPTPAGIGFVEGGMTLSLSSLGLSLGAAAVVALAYRGITFWLPFLFGILSFRFLSNAKEIEPIT